MPSEKVRRVTVMLSPDADETLRRLAAARFLGNMSATTSWAIGLAAAVLDGPLTGRQVPMNPGDVLSTVTGMKTP